VLARYFFVIGQIRMARAILSCRRAAIHLGAAIDAPQPPRLFQRKANPPAPPAKTVTPSGVTFFICLLSGGGKGGHRSRCACVEKQCWG